MNYTGWLIFFLYLVVLQGIGLYAAQKKETFEDYFRGNGNLPWWAICFSIVATETSSLTFISIPAVAYTGDLGFLQIALGYILGRIAVALFFLPRYFAGKIETVYQFLEHRYNTSMRRMAALLFAVTRVLSDGVRLFATAIPLALLTGWSYELCIIAFVVATIPYTLAGGIRSVVWTDTMQMAVYLGGGIGVSFFLQSTISEIPLQKFTFITSGLEPDLSQFFFKPYNLFAGILGGGILTLFTHGTDQLTVQRLLAAASLRDSQKALITSGLIVFAQFFLFLFLGLQLFVFFSGRQFSSPDAIFPEFILNHLPVVFKAVIIAAIFASAQSTLSSTLNALASSSMLDLFPALKKLTEKSKLRYSRSLTAFWAFVLIIVSLSFQDQKSPMVILGLKIASVPAGGIIALYLLGFSRIATAPALTGFAGSLVAMVYIVFFTKLAWTWYAPIGMIIALLIALLTTLISGVRRVPAGS